MRWWKWRSRRTEDPVGGRRVCLGSDRGGRSVGDACTTVCENGRGELVSWLNDSIRVTGSSRGEKI